MLSQRYIQMSFIHASYIAASGLVAFVLSAGLLTNGELLPAFGVGVLVSAVATGGLWLRRSQPVIKRERRADNLEAIGRAAAGVAHELSNPVTYIDSNLNALISDVEAYNEFIAVLDQASDHLEIRHPFYQNALYAYQRLDIARIVDTAPVRVRDALAGIDRIDSIMQDLHLLGRRSTCDMRLADINSALPAVRRRLQVPEGAELDWQLIEVDPLICHPARYARMLEVVIDNALQAIPDEGGKVVVAQRIDDDHFITDISDNGVGMDEKILRRIFEPFFTTRDEGKGTGIGLALCYKLIREHQGFVEVRSHPGAGSCFTLTIPMQQGDTHHAD